MGGNGSSLDTSFATAAKADPVTFAGSPEILRLQTPSTFSGEIIGFTGDGTVTGSDQIDLRHELHNASVEQLKFSPLIVVLVLMKLLTPASAFPSVELILSCC